MSKTYSINYNLRKPGRNYQSLINTIKSLSGLWAHPGGSHWFVSTNLSGPEIRARLYAVMDTNDQLYIHTVGDDWWSQNAPADITDWLKQNWKSSCRV
jgi:hypothetical protein